MEKIVEGFLSKIGEYLAEATINQGRYLCCFNNIVHGLKEEERKLISAERRMKEEVERARNNTIIIDEDVDRWLSDASMILAEVQILNQEIEVKTSCLNGWCPNWGCRYWLGRKATKKTINMERVVENGKFENLGHPAPLPDDSEFLLPKDFEFLQSANSVFEQIIRALKNDQINLVGLHGMGGTGKTTLAKAVGKKVKEGTIFDKVIMAVISQTPNFEDIQAHLAESLGLKLEEKTEEDRAKRLYRRFMGTDTQNDTETNKKQEIEKKILVILDDVWKSFDLKAKIGISFEGYHKGCKVLLTTRLEQVCIDMDCQQRTQLNVLEEKEGLTLLKRHARIVDDDSELNAVASQVARQCGGLPLALVAIGCALKEKGIDDWKVMCEKLERSKLEDIPNSIVAGDQGIYATLRVSYDYLKGEKTKQCFLLCSLFPEDHAIRLEELFWYAMGLGWYRDADSIGHARIELHSTVRNLKTSGLLLDSEASGFLFDDNAGEEYVKMHDMVRDVALWIASKGENVFMSKVGMGQIGWSKEEDWERYTAISLMANKIEELSIGFVCPKLEILILGGEGFRKNLKVSDECFKEMKGLKVLSLTHVDLSLKSLQFLINLKTLRLSYCNTRDISYLKKLNRLEILVFCGASFDELPREINELHNLRLFYLDKLARIPSNVLQRCSKLEELYTLNSSFLGRIKETNMASIFEVISLSCLSALHLNIYATSLPKDLDFPKLQRYVICVNTYCNTISYNRALEISNIEAVSLIAFKALYETLEYLHLKEVTGCQNILPSMDRGFNELKEADISACGMLQEVFQLEGLCHGGKEVLRRLAKLRLEKLPLLRHIWKGPIHHLNLQSLTYLWVDSCNILEHIFPISIARDLVRLEELTIRNAPQLKQVFYLDHAREEIAAENDGKDIELPKLRILRLDGLQSLTSFLPENYHSKWPMLEELRISKCSSLTTSFISEVKMEDLKEKLRVLEIECCRNQLYDGLTLSCLRYGFKNLEELIINNCGIKVVFHLEGFQTVIDREKKESLSLPSLKKLRMISLKELEDLVKDPKDILSLQYLTHLFVSKCPKLRHDFLPTLARNLRLLEELSIEKLEEIENVIGDNEEDHPQPLFFPNLRAINVEWCAKLKYLFPISIAQHLQQLESIKVKNCHQLEKVFEHKDGVDIMNDKEIPLLQLKHLLLEELSSLINFGPVGYHYILKLNSLHMSGCNRMCAGYLDIYHDPAVVICGLQRELRSLEAAKGLCKLYLIKSYNLKQIFSSNLAQDLLQLKELYIISCEELEQIIVEDEINIQTPFFPNLSKIDVRGYNKLKHLFPVYIAAGLQQLESINVHDCDQLQKVFGHENGADDTNDKEIMLPQLKELSLSKLPSLTDFGPVDYQFILKLQVLKIKCCPKLRHVFSCNHARNLLPLEELSIEDCEEMECVVVEDNEEDQSQPLLFPNLREINVNGCGKLKYLFPISITQHLQQLESIEVQSCHQLEKVFEDKDGADVMNDKEIILPQLKELSLFELPSLTNFGPMGYHFILKLERSLQIGGCHQMCAGMYCQGPVIVTYGLQRELRSLEVENLLGPQSLFALCIVKSHSLKHIFSSNLAQDLSQLKELYIISCEELEQIIVEDEINIQTPFFPNLSKIDVRGCNKLKHLFPVNIATGLQQLESINVQECDQLQKVFGYENGADDTKDKEIVLPQLKILSFKELPNLTNFGPVGYRFSMQLKSLSMEGCNDELWKSYFGDWEDLSVDSFKVTGVYYNQEYVTVTFRRDGGCEFKISGVDKSNLSCVTDPLGLSLCRGLTLTFTLGNLSDLGIHECHKMIHILSSNLARNLLRLSYLNISNCEELEQIIVEDGEDDHIQTSFFPNLWGIHISGCNKLKYVFPITMVRGLQELEWISVEECDQLEEVFIDGDNVMDDKEVVFSPCETLQLVKLPRLINFCSPGYHCIFPSLRSFRVKDCPNIATRFSRGEGRSVHAECKPPNQGGKAGDQPTIIEDIFSLPLYSKGSPSSRKQNGEET